MAAQGREDGGRGGRETCRSVKGKGFEEEVCEN